MELPNVFAGGDLDRAAHLRREQDWLLQRLIAEGSRVLPVWRSRNLVTGVSGEDRPRAVDLAGDAVRELLRTGEAIWVFLGLQGESACFALDVSHLPDPARAAPLAERGDFVELRQVGALLDRGDGALLAYARAMMSWHRRHLHCGSCGRPTVSERAGHQRVCSSQDCRQDHFPRTDPAVIMLVSRGDRCLLGRQAAWPRGMYSTLAGFVEPGESVEEAVAREVHEEAGVRVGRVTYHSSQPWPFPASLMLGFNAEAESDELRVDPEELEDARWLSRAEIHDLTARRELMLPSKMSIARRLVEDWLARG